MDHTTIDHIMSAVNGMNGNNEDMAYFNRVLPHRSPITKNTNESFLSQPNMRSDAHSHNKINQPVDPVKSISSNDNYSNSSNDNDFFEITQPEHKTNSKINGPAKSRRLDTHTVRGRKTTKVDVDNNSDISNVSDGTDVRDNIVVPNNDNGTPNTDNNGTIQPAHLTNIFGYNIPTSTLYFIIILVLIAVGLFFLTAEKKKPVKHDSDKNKRKEESD